LAEQHLEDASGHGFRQRTLAEERADSRSEVFHGGENLAVLRSQFKTGPANLLTLITRQTGPAKTLSPLMLI